LACFLQGSRTHARMEGWGEQVIAEARRLLADLANRGNVCAQGTLDDHLSPPYPEAAFRVCLHEVAVMRRLV